MRAVLQQSFDVASVIDSWHCSCKPKIANRAYKLQCVPGFWLYLNMDIWSVMPPPPLRLFGLPVSNAIDHIYIIYNIYIYIYIYYLLVQFVSVYMWLASIIQAKRYIIIVITILFILINRSYLYLLQLQYILYLLLS